MNQRSTLAAALSSQGAESKDGSMNVKQMNTLRATAIASGLISLPLPWVSAQKTLDLSAFWGDVDVQSVFSVNAFEGQVTVLLKMPLWFVVVLGIAANALQWMSLSRFFEVPRFVEWGATGLAFACVAIPFSRVVVSSENWSIGLGYFLGLYCAIVPLICLCLQPAAIDTPPEK